MSTEDRQISEVFDSWGNHPVIEIEPTTEPLDLVAISRCLTRCYDLVDDAHLEWRLSIDAGSCTHSVSAENDVLERIEPVLHEALAGYTFTWVDSTDSPIIDESTLSGVEFQGHGARAADWQTGLRPLVDEAGPATDPQPALTSVVDALTDTEATVLYQALLTPAPSWTSRADERCHRLAENRDTRAMRGVDFLTGASYEDITERATDPTHQARIERIRAADTRHSFDVAARAIAWGPSSEQALDTLGSALTGSNGRFYEVVSVPVENPLALAEDIATHTVPVQSRWNRLWQWLCGLDHRPTIVADPRTLAHLCLIDGYQLTEAGRRTLATTPGERTELPHPDSETLAQYAEGFTLGVPQTASTATAPPIALPPSMQPMHLLLFGSTGSGKTSLGLTGFLENHAVTPGASILIDHKGDGMPLEYLQAHYARYGSLDDVLYFDCATCLPALSFFDIRPQLASGIDRITAVEDVVDHYVELLVAIMGAERFERAVRSPDIIRYLLKAQFDPVHGSDAFAHSDLQDAAMTMKETHDAPPVSDPELERMLGGVASNSKRSFDELLQGVANRIEKIPVDARLGQLFNHVPDEDDPRFDFYDLLNDDVVIIFDTSGLRPESQRALTLVLLSNLWTALKRRANGQDASERALVNLYIEEAASIATAGLMEALLSQGRGFGLSITLAMQFPAQLNSKNPRAYAEVLNNVATIVTGKVGVDDNLAKRFATEDMSPGAAANRLRALSRGEWLARLPARFGMPEPRPFTLKSAPLPSGHPESDEPLTPAMQAAFGAALGLITEDTRDRYGLDVAAPARAQPTTTRTASMATDDDHVLAFTNRFPDGVEYDGAAKAFSCTHCDRRYEISLDGLTTALECCYGLDRIDRDDIPLCSLSLKLSPEEQAATGYTLQQLYFLQAVYDAHQQRFDPEWEYDIIYDSMVRLQEYTGVDHEAVQTLINDGHLRIDGDLPHRLYTVTASGRELLNEAHKTGIAHGDGIGDLGESSLHIMMVELGRRYIDQAFVQDSDSPVEQAVTYYPAADNTRLDAAGLDSDGQVVVTLEAERTNHDLLEAVPSDYDKMAALEPTTAIWLVEQRTAAHDVLRALNEPKHGPPRIEKSYSDSVPPQRFTIESPGLTEVHTIVYLRNSLLDDL